MSSISPPTHMQTIALIGNPNVGKSSIFNQLTGLNQKIGNYPGVTVDKSLGFLEESGQSIQLIDLPGTYSLYPKSEDELIAYSVLSERDGELDGALVVLDACNLERGLLLATQLMDLGLPIALVLNMKDMAADRGLELRTHALFKALQVPLILTDARKAEGIQVVKELLYQKNFKRTEAFIPIEEVVSKEILAAVAKRFQLTNLYKAFQLLVFAQEDTSILGEDRKWLEEISRKEGLDIPKAKLEEALKRNEKIAALVRTVVSSEKTHEKSITNRLDTFFLHPLLGYLLFFGIMLVIFQAVFAWAAVPMDWIDAGIAGMASWITQTLPAGVFTNFLAEGLIPGIGGIVIFIPQIAILFGFLAFLEDTGYLSRVVFLMDRIMKPFGLHGKSVVPLISGMACAIPAVMATRTISNNKERLITILVAPWMSCSARLPIYIIMIGLIIPAESILGINAQALALLGMYLLGTVATLVGAFLLNLVFSQKQKSYLLTEMPVYRFPRWKAVVLTMVSKSKVFVLEAGKVILTISIVLWVLSSYGPPSTMDALEEAEANQLSQALSSEEISAVEELFASKRLESSYMGIMGKAIEPVIQPLGYDWKIGIALITSFAAREVFVGTIATIYSIGGDVDNELTIREKLSQETSPVTGEKVFNLATGLSLMVFYAFAMQCMSTLAVVKRETKSWKWPILQTLVMSSIAYVAAWITYQIWV
jgi:ferrous iron transport protein B